VSSVVKTLEQIHLVVWFSLCSSTIRRIWRAIVLLEKHCQHSRCNILY